VLIYGGLTVATNFAGPTSAEKTISLAPRALPLYTLYSLTRMFIAYVLAILFSIFYGRMAAYNRRAEKVMLPLLDVLQSVPIPSFLPVVLLSLSAIMPQRLAVELASIVLIFTSQA
jgi:NitT/TauT family transport system permease protein